MDTGPYLIELIPILILIVFSAFFSSAETALSSVNKLKLRTMIEQGDKRAIKLDKILNNYSRMISTILIGNNIVNLSASALATEFTIKAFGDKYIGICTGILTMLVLTFGEILPKTVARNNCEKIAFAYTTIIEAIMLILYPLSFVITKVFSMDFENNESIVTETEIKAYIDVGHEDGVIETEEHELIQNIFEFSDTVVRDIMIPRIKMIAVNKNDSYDDIENTFKEYMYTRLPVYEDNIENIIGTINIKEFLFIKDREQFNIDDILRKPNYTFEFKKTSDLLLEMRKNGYNLAFVVSEYGACLGMITLEDLLEEIVGDIKDEFDTDESDSITQISDNLYNVEGSTSISDINEKLGTEFSSDEYGSVAGLIIEELERLPRKDDLVTFENGVEMQVVDVKQNRVTEINIKIP